MYFIEILLVQYLKIKTTGDSLNLQIRPVNWSWGTAFDSEETSSCLWPITRKKEENDS